MNVNLLRKLTGRKPIRVAKRVGLSRINYRVETVDISLRCNGLVYTGSS